jgi:uncharacterized GH25 family protein
VPIHVTSRVATVAILLAVVCAPTAAGAHDFWIEPAAFRPAIGQSVPVTLRVGEDFRGTTQPFVPGWFLDFSVTGTGAREPIRGLPGDDPAATLRFDDTGLRTLGYHSSRSFVELDPDRFEKYLRAEGLERVVELRRQRKQSGVHAREYYSRCSKSLLSVGQAKGGPFDPILGYPLELIPGANPYALEPGARLPLLLQYQGKPIGDVLIIAFTADQPERKVSVRTGRDGRVVVPLDRAGRWLVKAVHMIELKGDPGADWESFWASLTFELAGR